jgi:hypothetical protein
MTKHTGSLFYSALQHRQSCSKSRLMHALQAIKLSCCVTGENGQRTTGLEDANEGGSNVVVILLWEGAMLW